MNRKIVQLAMIAQLAVATSAWGAATMTQNTSPPATGTHGIANLNDTLDIILFDGANWVVQNAPGDGMTAGGGFGGQAFTDNGGPPGQTITTLNAAPLYRLDALTFKGEGVGGDAEYGVAGPPYYAGNGIFNVGTTWSIRISSVSGTTLTPIKTVTGIPTVVNPGAGLDPNGDEWFTWQFTGLDTVALNPASQYAFEVLSSAGYLGVDASPNTAYAGGQAFNSTAPARTFNGNTTGNLANHGYDRTFVVNLAVPPAGTVAGDTNANGVADINDYNTIKANLEQSVTAFTNGDLDGNGFVDLLDFRRWTNAVPPAVAASVGIPEPTAGSLAAVAAALIGRYVRRRRVGQRHAAVS